MLLLPLGYWKLTEKATELGVRVFLRGIKFAFTQSRRDNKGIEPIETMANLEPILSKVPKPLVAEALAFGRTIDDPAIRSICHFFVNDRM